MIRVLLAEDELPLLRGLKGMIESLNPEFRVAFAAKNGKEAADYLAQNEVDVVFTDVNMPLMDGLRLLKLVSEDSPDVKRVVISGYNDFEYARGAMKYGAADYLLKPVDRVELSNLLSSLENQINRKSYTQKREFLTRALFSAGEPPQGVFWKDIYLLCCCAGSCSRPGGGEETPADEFWKDNRLLAGIRAALRNTGDVWCFWGYRGNEAFFVIELEHGAPVAPAADKLCSLLPGEPPVTVAVSTCIKDLSALPVVSHALISRITRQAVFGRSGVLWEDAVPERIRLAGEEAAALSLAVQKGDFSGFQKEVQALGERLNRREAVQAEVESALQQVITLAGRNAKEEELARLFSETDELVASEFTYDGLMEGFCALCRAAFFNTPFDTGNKQDLMRQVDEYIQENISKPLNTKVLSGRFGLVAPYLSKLFKEYKGASPAQYIQNIRLERAKRLLVERPQMLAKDIAESLGYTNALYFSKTFKKNVGLYPSEYRQQNRRD